MMSDDQIQPNKTANHNRRTTSVYFRDMALIPYATNKEKNPDASEIRKLTFLKGVPEKKLCKLLSQGI
jgi:hypothetical protein